MQRGRGEAVQAPDASLQSGKGFKNAGLFGPRVKILKNDLLNKKFRRHGQGLKFLSKANPPNHQRSTTDVTAPT